MRLPVSPALPELIETRRAALHILHIMERRFATDSGLHQMYVDFMTEYEEFRHMTPAPPLTDEAVLSASP